MAWALAIGYGKYNKYINNIFVTHSDYIIKKDQDEEGKKLLEYYDEILKENSHKLDELGITKENLVLNN